jgi:cobalt/nickel transport system permease protein
MIVRSIDPRVALVLALSGSILLAAARGYQTLAVGLITSIVLVLVRRVKVRVLTGRLVRLQLFLSLLFLLLPLSWRDGTLAWDSARLELPLVIALRAHAILLWVTAWVEPLGVAGLLHGMRGIGVPAAIVQIAMLSVRYLSLMQGEFRQMRMAMASRGYSRRAPVAAYQVWANLIGMLFLRSLDRAEHLRRSMAARSLGNLTTTLPVPWQAKDRIVLAVGMIGLAMLAYLEWLTRVDR